MPLQPVELSERADTQLWSRRVNRPAARDVVTFLWKGDRLCQFPWGRSDAFGTAGYWTREAQLAPEPPTWRLGADLREEIAACLLGGHGVSARVALGAFEALRGAGLLRANRGA